LDELQAAFLSVKLRDLDNANQKRREIAQLYLKGIRNPLITLPVEVENNKHVWHLFVVRTANREHFQNYLSENGIQTVIHYPIPPHHQLAYKELVNNSYPISEKIHNEVISIPISPVMSEQEVNYVIDIVNKYSN
jgi:dTDP-4-amino-4,6-dideoxygalactose transaminase